MAASTLFLITQPRIQTSSHPKDHRNIVEPKSANRRVAPKQASHERRACFSAAEPVKSWMPTDGDANGAECKGEIVPVLAVELIVLVRAKDTISEGFVVVATGGISGDGGGDGNGNVAGLFGTATSVVSLIGCIGVVLTGTLGLEMISGGSD